MLTVETKMKSQSKKAKLVPLSVKSKSDALRKMRLKVKRDAAKADAKAQTAAALLSHRQRLAKARGNSFGAREKNAARSSQYNFIFTLTIMSCSNNSLI